MACVAAHVFGSVREGGDSHQNSIVQRGVEEWSNHVCKGRFDLKSLVPAHMRAA